MKRFSRFVRGGRTKILRSSSRKRTQHIHIQYDGIGVIPLDERMKEETA